MRSAMGMPIGRRRVIQLLGAAGAAVSLAACGGGSPAPTETAKPASAPASQSPASQSAEKPAATGQPAEKSAPAAAAPALGAPVNVVQWLVTKPGEIDAMTKDVVKTEFQARNGGVTVENLFIPGNQMLTKLNTGVQGGNAPDIAYIDETYLPDLFEQKAILPIPKDVFDVEKEMGPFVTSQFFIPPGPDAKFYALPMGYFARSVFYNIDFLARYNYQPKDVPPKWDDLIKFVQPMTKWEGNKVVESGWAMGGGHDVFSWMGAFVQLGGWYYLTQRKSGWGSPENEQAAQHTLDLWDKHKLDSRTNIPATELFGNGKAALICTQTNYFGTLQAQYPNIKWGTLPKPSFTGGGPYGLFEPDVGFAVTSQTKDPKVLDGTWKLFQYMQGPDYMRRYCRLRGVHPTILSLQKEKLFSVDDPQWHAIALKAKPGNFTSEGYSPQPFFDIRSDSMNAIRNDGKPIKETLQAAATKVDAELAKYKFPWTILSKEEFAKHPEWSDGKIPVKS